MDVLLHKRLTLLDPGRWDDKNDASFLAEYKRQVEAKALLALCFTKSSETYHHWRTYSHGPDGVCFEFDDNKLVQSFKQHEEVITGDAIYLEIGALEQQLPTLEEMPFVKRYPYMGENEFRVLYVNMRKATASKHLPIDLAWIRRVTLSPWMPSALVRTVVTALKTVAKSSDIEIYQSKLIDYPRWRTAIARKQQTEQS